MIKYYVKQQPEELKKAPKLDELLDKKYPDLVICKSYMKPSSESKIPYLYSILRYHIDGDLKKLEEATGIEITDEMRRQLDRFYYDYTLTSIKEDIPEIYRTLMKRDYTVDILPCGDFGFWCIYPQDEYSKKDLDYLGAICYNTGAEYIVDTEKPSDVEHMSGKHIYLEHADKDELADYLKCSKDEIVLYTLKVVTTVQYSEE